MSWYYCALQLNEVALICIHTGSGDVTQIVFNLGTKCECLMWCPGHFTPTENIPPSHWTEGKVGPRGGLNIWRINKFPAFAGIRTQGCPHSSLVTVLTMLCHLHDVPNKIKVGPEMCNGKVCGHKLGFITDDKQDQSNC